MTTRTKRVALYQIVRKPKDGRWSFYAHGAAYTASEADEACKLIATCSGDKTRLLRIQ